ncbi:MAG: ABC transporter ATP-binding protein [Planctomycetes bacterium]|nr:ABC transporter ATP-binding protein [Planctomycetota bacterium]
MSVQPAQKPAGAPLLQVKNLQTHFAVGGMVAKAVSGVSFDLHKGEVLGIVGESGSGKSVTALSLIRLIPDPPGKIVGGEVIFNGQDLLKMPIEDVRKIRGRDIGMIFQEPMTSLNPVFTIGKQVMEPLLFHEKLSKAEARNRAIEALAGVGIPDAARRLDDYPHQFSGGMRQRVMIAMMMVCNPAILIADEPSTALDVTIQAQVLELMLDLRRKREGAAIILITHDLAVVAETCDRVLVMYGGKVQEASTVVDLFENPMHPYTRGLMKSIPHAQDKGKRLTAIRGNVPSIFDLPDGCKFCTRCPDVMDRCWTVEPELREVTPGHWVRCHLTEDKK